MIIILEPSQEKQHEENIRNLDGGFVWPPIAIPHGSMVDNRDVSKIAGSQLKILQTLGSSLPNHCEDHSKQEKKKKQQYCLNKRLDAALQWRTCQKRSTHGWANTLHLSLLPTPNNQRSSPILLPGLTPKLRVPSTSFTGEFRSCMCTDIFPLKSQEDVGSAAQSFLRTGCISS